MSSILLNIAKNALAPLACRVAPRRGSLGIHDDPEMALATFHSIGSYLSAAEPTELPPWPQPCPGRLELPLRAFADAVCLELGPGRGLHLLLMCLLAGAGKCVALDVASHLRADPSLSLRELLAAVSSSERYWVRAPVPAVDTGRIEYRIYNGRDLPLPDQSTGLLFSVAVLEHVRFPQALVRDMFRVVKRGGFICHIIGLMDHTHIVGRTGVAGDWLEMLRYPQAVYDLMFSRRSTYVNRLRACEWRQLFLEAGFAIRAWLVDRYSLDGVSLDAIHERWRGLGPEELSAGFLTVLASRP